MRRSGTVLRFSGGGALEKSSRAACGACRPYQRGGGAYGCWDGANMSLPNQPPPRCWLPNQPPRCGGGRCSPKLKNCAEVGPARPKNSPTAIANAISQPRSVKMSNLFGSLGMLLDRTRRTCPNQTSTEGVWWASVYREARLTEQATSASGSDSGSRGQMSMEFSGRAASRERAFRTSCRPGLNAPLLEKDRFYRRTL